MLPIPALEIVDDWRVLGLAGAGSKSLHGEDVFVPEWRSITDREFLGNAGPGRSLHGHCHLYRLSRYARPGPLSLAMAGVGIARHAVDYCTAHFDRMGVGRTSAVEREAIRHDSAEATTEVDAARLLIRRTVSEIERASKERIEPVPRALVKLVARDRHFATAGGAGDGTQPGGSRCDGVDIAQAALELVAFEQHLRAGGSEQPAGRAQRMTEV